MNTTSDAGNSSGEDYAEIQSPRDSTDARTRDHLYRLPEISDASTKAIWECYVRDLLDFARERDASLTLLRQQQAQLIAKWRKAQRNNELTRQYPVGIAFQSCADDLAALHQEP